MTSLNQTFKSCMGLVFKELLKISEKVIQKFSNRIKMKHTSVRRKLTGEKYSTCCSLFLCSYVMANFIFIFFFQMLHIDDSLKCLSRYFSIKSHIEKKYFRMRNYFSQIFRQEHFGVKLNKKMVEKSRDSYANYLFCSYAFFYFVLLIIFMALTNKVSTMNKIFCFSFTCIPKCLESNHLRQSN